VVDALDPTDLAVLVTADAVVRHLRAQGSDSGWSLVTSAAGLGVQQAAEREAARAGHDRATLPAEEFEELVRLLEVAQHEQVAATLEALRVHADMDQATLAGETTVRAARTAFVRLYDQGLLERAERVVLHCPRCATVVGDQDVEPVDLEGERLTVIATVDDGEDLLVALVEPELLAGVVAISVPPGHAAGDHTALVPISGHSVPVLVAPESVEPAMVVPAHSQSAWEAARGWGLPPVPVLDDEGVVLAELPLHGLSRYAARAATKELLAAEDALVGVEAALEHVFRCRRCGTVLVPVLGRHWFLHIADLEVAAADKMREGVVRFSPPDIRAEVLATAGTSLAPWCVSSRVVTAPAVPVSTCLDCGRDTVDAEATSSCGKCMGTLVAADERMDARLLEAVWSLSAAGWPLDSSSPGILGATTSCVVRKEDVSEWLVPIAALSLRLTGHLPFCQVTVVPQPPPDSEESGDPLVRRLLLLGGMDDTAAAEAFLRGLDDPPLGNTDLEALGHAFTLALEEAWPSAALKAMATAMADGVPPSAGDLLQVLVAPLLGR